MGRSGVADTMLSDFSATELRLVARPQLRSLVWKLLHVLCWEPITASLRRPMAGSLPGVPSVTDNWEVGAARSAIYDPIQLPFSESKTLAESRRVLTTC